MLDIKIFVFFLFKKGISKVLQIDDILFSSIPKDTHKV